jgi:hypothetical protein
MATVLENRMFERKILIAFLGRVLAVLVLGALAACAGTNTSTAPVAAATPRSVAAGRGQTAPPPPPAPPEEPASQPTLQKARAECWMKLDSDRKAPREPEKRLPLVEKCVEEKMGAPPPTAQAPQ